MVCWPLENEVNIRYEQRFSKNKWCQANLISNILILFEARQGFKYIYPHLPMGQIS